jgi:LDH2 family malate/lactate/ureidoglycolate dehydrogenase
MNDYPQDCRNIKADTIKHFAKDVFMKHGVSGEHAQIIAESLVFADLRGIHTHGVFRIPSYLQRIEIGAINKQPEIRVIQNFGAMALVDGDNGPGQISACYAMNLAIERARKHGISLCGVVNGGHIGALAYWSTMALSHNMMGFCTSNATALMPPWGAKRAALSNMPLSIAAPADKQLPVVLDMALSQTARGNIILVAQKGRKIPLGWALDKDGIPTDDPNAALKGTVLPVAEYKGSGLAILIEILCAALLGGKFSHECGDLASKQPDEKEVLGFNNIFGAINLDAFHGFDYFKKRCDEIIDYLKTLPKADGYQEILMPGEIQMRIARERSLNGIPIDSAILKKLNEIAAEQGINPLF